MSKANSFEDGLMLLLFNNTNFANVGDVGGLRGCAAAGTSLYVSLHSADPGETGVQSTLELTYAGTTPYARVGVLRASGASGWTCTANAASNTSTVTFPQNTAGSVTATHVGVGTASSGAGILLYSSELLGAMNAVSDINIGTDTITTSAAHSLSDGMAVRVRLGTGGTIPAGLSTGTQYFVVSSAASTLKLALTAGGSAVDITSIGYGPIFVARDFYATIGTNATPSFAAGQLAFSED